MQTQKKELEQFTSNHVPVISKKDLDAEATRFLKLYCPEALTIPMAVPIEDIVTGAKMRLTLIKDKRLTDDFHLFGQICFSEGQVKVYNVLDGSEEEIKVGRGTILIDAMIYKEHNLGCANNTIAHEAFHWHRHRVYAAMKSNGDNLVAFRCPTKSKPYHSGEGKSPWTDEDWMEWQANHVAPRILMPIQTVKVKIEDLYAKYEDYRNEKDRTWILEHVINDLAQFYKVSKQAAKIRMLDLGYEEAETVYNHYDQSKLMPYFTSISQRDAFNEYCDNDEFRQVIDTGLFRYVDGCYVIDSDKYVIQIASNRYALTDYARKHLDECALTFTYRYDDMRDHGQSSNDVFHRWDAFYRWDAFHRENPESLKKVPSYAEDKNASIASYAKAFKVAFENEYARIMATSKSFSHLCIELMKFEGWNAHRFAESTGLEPNNYYRIAREESINPTFETVLNICIGLKLPPQIRDELIRLAGFTWRNTRLHCAYRFILESGNIQSITDFNDAFAALGIDPSGKPPLKDGNFH